MSKAKTEVHDSVYILLMRFKVGVLIRLFCVIHFLSGTGGCCRSSLSLAY